MPRIPLIRFPKRNLKAPSPSAPAASQPADQHATLMFRLGGPASLLPKRKPLTEEEIEAIMLGGSI
uniref:Uncharacterized protein n=1 Tax=Zea mays TaxID=4577 RepID=A0A804PXE3_MAIZE